MRLSNRLRSGSEPANDIDPREESSAEIIDLASRTAYPAVARKSGKSDALGMVAGIAVVAVLGAATLWGLNASRPDPAAPAATAPVATTPVSPVSDQPARFEAEDEGPLAMPPQTDPAPAPVLAAPPEIAAMTQANPYSSPTVVFDAGVAAPATVAAQVPGADAAATPGEGSASDFASRVGGVGGGPATAARNFDPATTVTQGTLIPAVLETAIDTDVPGFVRAIVSQDVRSYDGRRVLVPRSSRLVGQYQSGLQNGQKRAYIIWTRLIRPDGVSVALASPATDFAGNTGLPGEVDNHFFKRFGSAMLLSVIGGLTTIASGGSSIILGGGGDAAAAAINQGSNIGPTVRVRQGEPIRVFTARDLDFSQAPRLN